MRAAAASRRRPVEVSTGIGTMLRPDNAPWVSEQAAVVRRIFGSFDAGHSLIGITNALNDEGILTFTGRTWASLTLRNMLRNPVYAGHTFYRRPRSLTHATRGPGVVEFRNPREWIEVPGATPAIVSDALSSKPRKCVSAIRNADGRV